MIFISAGHNNMPGKDYDPGAVYNGRKEADEAVRMRDAVISHLAARNAVYSKDNDGESLRNYLARIKPGSGSVVCEFHMNAGGGTGVEVLVQSDADKLDLACARELCDASARMMGIKNRGVKSEAQSHHGRLALMREAGIVVLIELCFIDNASDLRAYDAAFHSLALTYAMILMKYDGLMG